MKVAQLIQELLKCPQDAEVVMQELPVCPDPGAHCGGSVGVREGYFPVEPMGVHSLARSHRVLHKLWGGKPRCGGSVVVLLGNYNWPKEPG